MPTCTSSVSQNTGRKDVDGAQGTLLSKFVINDRKSPHQKCWKIECTIYFSEHSLLLCCKYDILSQVREAELLVSTMVEEGERRATESERLQQELIRARFSEKQAKEKLNTLVKTFNSSICHSAANSSIVNSSILGTSLLNNSTMHLPPPAYSHR